jgi:CHAT domain-containing protein
MTFTRATWHCAPGLLLMAVALGPPLHAQAADALAPAATYPTNSTTVPALDPADPQAQLAEAIRLFQLGRYDEAAPFAQRALKLAEALLPPDDPRLADLVTTLGVVDRAAGRLDAAQALFERALAIREKALGPEDTQTAVALNNLGALALARNDAARAQPLLERALRIREKALGPDSPAVATGLTNLASAFDQLGRPHDALPLHARALAIREKNFGPDDPQTATALNNLAETTGELGRYREALRLQQRALAIREKVLGPEHPDTAVSVSNIAVLLETLGRLDEALALQRRALGSNERLLGPEHPATAITLSNLASVYATIGRFEEAQPLLERALNINTKAFGPQSVPVATTTGRLATLALQQGEYARALPLAQRAVAMREQLLGPDHPDTAIAINNLAEIYAGMGEYGQAVTLHRRAQAIRERALGPDHPEVASGLNNLAALYKALGQYPLAKPLLQRALAIREKRLGPNNPDTALSLNNLAQLYVAEGHPELALPLARRGLAIAERALGPDHPDTATALGNLAGILEDLKQLRTALPLQQRSLAIREAAFGPLHANVAISLNNLAALYETLGESRRALPLYNRAYAILEPATNRVALAAVASRLGRYYNVHHEPDLAIFYLKQAVNSTQLLRGSAATLEAEAQRSLAHRVESRYRLLATLLVQRGRLAEAEEILALLKLQERRELVRGDAQDGSPGAPATLTPAERELAARLSANAESLATKYAELEALDQQGDQGADAQRRRSQLSEHIQADGEALDALLKESVATLATASAQGAFASAVMDRDAIANQLATLNERSGAHAAAVYFVPGERSTTFLVVTAQGAVGVSGGVGEAELNHLAGAMRQAIQARSTDYRSSAGKLYAALITPIVPTLKAAHVDTLMLYLVGSLRYVPVAALYDGTAHRHLIEQYALAAYAVANLGASLAEPPIAHWVAAGVGVSREFGEFPALTAVPGELASIVQTSEDAANSGVLPGQRFLNDAFTRDSLHTLARRRSPFSVLHVATHFKLVPGREGDSQLLLGDGDLLSMQQLRSDSQLVLGTYDLVTLSACNTSMGSDAGAGSEFEGLATTLLRKGARAVIASLWEVQDTGTAHLMRAFYAARGADRQRSKAAALRQAQVALLSGSVADETGKLDFRHPYYWASFILMGNWL